MVTRYGAIPFARISLDIHLGMNKKMGKIS